MGTTISNPMISLLFFNRRPPIQQIRGIKKSDFKSRELDTVGKMVTLKNDT